MTGLIDTLKGAAGTSKDSKFPDAPVDWTCALAAKTATEAGLDLGEDHWEALRALQHYYAKHEEITINMRELHDALDEKFHMKGGIKYLYRLFPGGPLAQGCRIAGLKAPAGATDRGFGSVA